MPVAPVPAIALEVWGADIGQVLATARRAEALGFAAFYYGESPHDLNLECWTTLGAVAHATSRIRLGPVIANNLPTWRHPALLARQAASVARISGGRLDLRTGVGAAAPFGRAWWGRYGVDYPAYGQRLADLAATLDALDRARADAAPALPPIPVTIAATGQRAMALAAARADRWEASFCTPAEVGERIAAMAALAAAVGRRLPCSLEIDGFVAATPAEVRRLLDRVRADRPAEDLEPVLARALTGTPHEIAPQLRALAAADVDQLVVALHDPHDPAALDALADAAELAANP